MTGLFLLLLAGFIKANATLDKSGHMMYVEYSISEPAKDQGVVYVDILFHHKGGTYRVARHRYPEPIVSIVDTFPWVSKDKWEGGDLEVVARKANGDIERSYISEKSIEVGDLGYKLPEFEHEVNGALVKVNNGPDPYAWRMLGYDPGHTGYYPFHLYPPLDSLWMYDWSGAGTWTTEISGAAGQEMIFIPEAPWGWNKIEARDIETGEIIWQRYVTANVWTSALSLDDSTLFVGTSIGYTPWQDTTFYALDPFTGELKWGKVLKTVEYSPIVVDSLVYVSSLGLPAKLVCWNYRGDSIWAVISWMSDGAPAYDDGMVFHTGKDTLHNIYEIDSTVYARNYLTGELIWDFTGSGEIFNLMAYEGKIVFSPFFDPLYALNSQTGDLAWTNWDYGSTINAPLNAGFDQVLFGHGVYVGDTIFSIFYVLNSINGELLWDTLLSPVDTNGGRMTRIVMTPDSMLWVANKDILYILKVNYPKVIYSLILPESPAQFSSWCFPIAYKNYFIYAHEDFLVVYRADTVMDTSGQDTLTDFQVYFLYVDGNPVLRLDVPYEGQISLKLFSIAGRKVWRRQIYFEKGTHFIDLPSLPSGVYFLFYDFKGHRGTKKIIILKT